MIQNIWKKPLVGNLHEGQSQKLKDVFYQLGKCKSPYFLALIKYLDKQPEKFYSKDIFEIYTTFLEVQFSKNPKRLISILNNKNHDLSNAFSLLDRINNESWHDAILPDNDYERMKFCDANLNPTYLKLVDGVYHHFIYILAACSRLERRKNAEGLDLFNCVEEIKSNYPSICGPYDNRIRNGIAHGGVVFKHFEIIYKDKKGKVRTIQTLDLPLLVDELVDTCNAIALAIRIFLTHLTQLSVVG